MNENQGSFTLAYSAREQNEIKKIRDKYTAREDKLERLRALDRKASSAGLAWSLSIGIVGSLIFGGGMSLALVGDGTKLIPGIILGVLGIAVLGLAYPAYAYLGKKARSKYTPEILRLSDELLNEQPENK